MLEFFKKNHIINSLLLLPYAVMLRLVVMIFPEARVPGEIYGTWGKDVIGAVQDWGLGGIITSTILIFIQAAMLNRLFIKQSMIGEINLYPGVCYILLSSLHPAFISFSSVMLANVTLIIGLGYLYDVLKKERQEETRFLLGLWFGVSGLLYSPYLMLLLFGLISMSILKTLKVKDIFQYMTGFLSPFLITYLVQIILREGLNPVFLHAFDSFGIPTFRAWENVSDIITICIMGFLLLISILGYTQVIARKNIHAQKKIDTLYALVFFCAFMVLFPQSISVQYLFVLLIPLSLFFAIHLRQIKNKAIAESLHFILLVASAISQVLFII